MRQSLVIGNWKMHGDKASNDALVSGICANAYTAEVAVCPPAVYIAQVAEQLKGTDVKLGAQNVCSEPVDSGAYTGEVAATMLKEFAADFVIIGHSERREYYNESDETVASKFKAVQRSGMTPVLCVGEGLDIREAGNALDFVGSQIKAIIEACGIENFENAVIAYEPIWAIGTGKTATPEQAQEVHAFIRELVKGYNETVADKIRILYGGSVKPDNAKTLFAMKDIDGALVGGASLDASSFSAICLSAE